MSAASQSMPDGGPGGASGLESTAHGASRSTAPSLCAACGYPLAAPRGRCAECGGALGVRPLAHTTPLRRAALVASLAAIASVFAGELLPRFLGWAGVLGGRSWPIASGAILQVGAIAGAVVAGGVVVHALHRAAQDDARLRARVAVAALVLTAVTAASVTVAPYMLARAGPRPQDDALVVLWSGMRIALPTGAVDLWLGAASGLLGIAFRRDAADAADEAGAERAAGVRLSVLAPTLVALTLLHVGLIAVASGPLAAVGGLRIVARWLVLPVAISAAAVLLRRVPAPDAAMRCRRAVHAVGAAIGLGVLVQLVAPFLVSAFTPASAGWIWWVVDGLVIAASTFAVVVLLVAWSILARADRSLAAEALRTET